MTPIALTPAAQGKRSKRPPTDGHLRRVSRPAGPAAPRRVSGPTRPAAGRTPARSATSRAPARSATSRAPARSASGRTPARPRRISTSVRQPLGARAIAFVKSLPDHQLLDRVVRGRAWIPILGVLLAGIVAMQVEVLKLGAGIGRSIERGTQLQSRNELLRASVATLADDQRIERLAAGMGMVMPAPSSVSFLSLKPVGYVQRAASSIHQPDPTGFLASLPAASSGTAAGTAGTADTSGTAGTAGTAGTTDTSGTTGTADTSGTTGTADTTGTSGTDTAGATASSGTTGTAVAPTDTGSGSSSSSTTGG
jgi:hypothetical protein